MDTATQVQIMDEAVFAFYIVFITYLWKDMNPTILPPSIGKKVWQTRIFSFGMATGLGERKIWIQIC